MRGGATHPASAHRSARGAIFAAVLASELADTVGLEYRKEKDMRRNNSTNKYTIFKAKHPKLHIANAFISMFLPFCLVGLFFAIFKVVDGRAVLAIYSICGSFVLGGGLTLCVAVDYDKEVFWRLCVYPIVIGALIVVCNIVCACNKELCSALNENLLTLQLTCYLSVFYFLLSYFIGRESITDYISAKTHLNEDQIDKRKNGFLNYLWYQKIHKEFDIGWIYYFNAFFTIILLLFLIGTSFLAFLKSISNVVILLGLIASLLSIILGTFVLVTAAKNKKSYHKTRRRHLLANIPYFYEIASIAVVLLFTWLQIKYFIAL